MDAEELDIEEIILILGLLDDEYRGPWVRTVLSSDYLVKRHTDTTTLSETGEVTLDYKCKGFFFNKKNWESSASIKHYLQTHRQRQVLLQM
jgi:hypothetical protein